MKKQASLKQYPWTVPALANGASAATVAIGFYLMSRFGLLFAFLYLGLCLFLEYRLIRNHCVDCFYYGKVCAFAKGWVCRLFFKKGKAQKFKKIRITPKDLLADFLVFLIPLAAGIIGLFISFGLFRLLLILILILLNTCGNSLIRGKLACGPCRQRTLGCPAVEFFEKLNKKSRRKRP